MKDVCVAGFILLYSWSILQRKVPERVAIQFCKCDRFFLWFKLWHRKLGLAGLRVLIIIALKM